MSGFEDKPGKVLRVALLGCGVVGTQVARLLREEAAELATRSGAQLEIAGIAVRRLSHPRPGVVAVRDGAAREIVRRETLDDLLRLDVG